MQRAVTVAPYRYRARVRVHAPAEEVRRATTASTATVEPMDGATCVLLSGSDSLYALTLHLGLLGWDFEVLEPPELREVVAVLADRLTRAAVS